ncbi:transposable element Tcb2 transposase [Trichonephila clavipes]|nr:transposable element Tcb2 transposase [Trichonephila clavipes]
MWDHEGRIRVRRYAGEQCLPECVIKRHSGVTPGVMVWDAISPPRSYFSACTPTCCKDCLDFATCSAQHMQLPPWHAFSPDVSPIEHVWDLVGRHLARDPRPAALKDELLLRIQAI